MCIRDRWRSFEPRVNFYGKWKALWPAIVIIAFIFVAWDIYFTAAGVWGFNPRYLIGIHLFNLPLEEVLFFICIPYACVFSYEALNYFIKRDFLKQIDWLISSLLIGVLSYLAIVNFHQWYTATTFISLSVCIYLLQFVVKVNYLGKFYRAYIFILLPFFLVNGILTGSGIPEQVVWYNESHFMGIRMGTIPVEDTFYGMLLILLNISLYEYFKKRLSI